MRISGTLFWSLADGNLSFTSTHFRQKIEPDSTKPRLIKTEPGIGTVSNPAKRNNSGWRASPDP